MIAERVGETGNRDTSWGPTWKLGRRSGNSSHLKRPVVEDSTCRSPRVTETQTHRRWVPCGAEQPQRPRAVAVLLRETPGDLREAEREIAH